MAIGHNPGINEAEPINSASKGDKAFQGKPPKTIRHSKEIPPHQSGPFTRGWSPRAKPARPRRMTTARLPVPPEHLRAVPPELLQVFRRNGRAMGRRRPTKKISGLCGRLDSVRPSGALVIASLASPQQPWETGLPQQWPRPTNFLRAKSRSFPTCPGSKKQLSL